MSVEKRYQVFISSTFEDLRPERQAALRSVLELGHMPAGMELFPATDEAAWELIKDVIDQSDYYVVIVGGRYGSLSSEGLSYTEREYHYAADSDKPVIALLHGEPGALPREKTETDAALWEKLKAFREKLQDNHTCAFWSKADDLSSRLIVALTTATNRYPGIGWVRGDQLPDEDVMTELLTLRSRVAELELEQANRQARRPEGSEGLQQGEDKFKVTTEFVAARPVDDSPWPEETAYRGSFFVTWDEMWRAVAPKLIDESTDAELKRALRAFWQRSARKAFEGDRDLEGTRLKDFTFTEEDVETCLVQFRALGLMEESRRKRSVKDTKTYWSLTDYGDRQMVRLRAIHVEAPKDAEREPTVAEAHDSDPDDDSDD